MPKSLSKTPAPAKDRIYGSKVNPKGSASSEKSAKNIKLSADILLALNNKLKEFKETHKTKKVSLGDLKAVYRRGLGAYSSTHRPTISGGKPNTRNAWAMARVNAFLRKAGGGEAKESYVQDDDLLKYAEGGEVDEHKETYKKWKSLVNMSNTELRRFYDSEEGKKAGLKPSEAKAQGIDSGRESARWIMKMKSTPVSKWTPAMWKWAKKQISFISRMSGMKGDLYDEKGIKTRKHLSLLIWGHNPKKYNGGGMTDAEIISKYGYLTDEQIDKLDKQELVRYIGKIDPFKPLFTRRSTTKNFREIAKKITNEKISQKKFKAGGETKSDMKFNEPIMYHEKNGNFIIGKNTIYYWLYDDKEAGKKLNDGEFDFVLFPPATLGMASQKGFVPPLQLIWRKKYQTKVKGSEHLIGIIQAFYDEKNKKMYIEMMTTNPKMKGKGIMTYLVKNLRQEFGLSQDDLIFVNTTKEGEKFKQAKHYENGGLIAPNGKPSNLTPEQYKLVRTPEFKAWFGDWENDPKNASKVVDENGEPLVVYHGTKYDFYTFREKQYIYTSDSSDYQKKLYTNKSDRILELFANSRNILDLSHFGDIVFDLKKLNEFFKQNSIDFVATKVRSIYAYFTFNEISIDILKKAGYDGVYLVFEEKYEGVMFESPKKQYKGYIFCEPNQIKLADGSNTTFDANNPDIRYDYGGELEKLGFTEEEIQNWKDENKVSQRQKQNTNVKEYALKLKSGEISQDEYLKAVKKYLPIIPFTEVPQIPTLLEIVGALDSNKVEKGIIGYTQFINDGEYVASRLDIPAYNNYDVWVVSVHDGMKEGNSIGYGQTAYLKNVDFKVFPKTALNIATERTDKTPFARIFGYWINKDPHEVREMAVKYMNDPEWVQVGMNPYRHSWFYDKSDGMPLLTAEEVIQVGALVLAKNPVKTTPDNPVFAVDKNNPDIKFKKGGIFKKHKSIEQISKEKNVSLSYAKEQLKKGMKIESEHSDSKEVQETIALQHLDEMINYYDKLKTIEN